MAQPVEELVDRLCLSGRVPVEEAEKFISLPMAFSSRSRKANIKDGRMTYGVVVSSAITFDIVALRRGDIGDDGEVTCGVVVSSRDSRDDGKLVDGGVVSSVITSNIVTFMARNTDDGRVESDTKYFKGEGLGEGDGRGERESMEVSSANRVDVVDNANMVSSGCIDCRGC
uniref:Uncharacterized protein n=1 Tax=Vitis vinifera TaxID=29760 RepID=A5BLV9_VITVI|nr:hypothetical protein VITISV_008488 [Vitis vinifera]